MTGYRVRHVGMNRPGEHGDWRDFWKGLRMGLTESGSGAAMVPQHIDENAPKHEHPPVPHVTTDSEAPMHEDACPPGR